MITYRIEELNLIGNRFAVSWNMVSKMLYITKIYVYYQRLSWMKNLWCEKFLSKDLW